MILITLIIIITSEAVKRERILMGRMEPIPLRTVSSNFLVSFIRNWRRAFTNFSLSENKTIGEKGEGRRVDQAPNKEDKI